MTQLLYRRRDRIHRLRAICRRQAEELRSSAATAAHWRGRFEQLSGGARQVVLTCLGAGFAVGAVIALLVTRRI